MAAAVIACAPGPAPASPVGAWSPPPDWHVVTVDGGGVELTLPPWLEAFDTTGAIFANERPAPGGPIPLQLMLLGPRMGDGPAPGETVLAWVERRLDEPGRGVPETSTVVLPAGTALRYARTDGLLTPNPWRFLVFVIETGHGLIWLQFDGPPDGWPSRAEAIERIPGLLRVG